MISTVTLSSEDESFRLQLELAPPSLQVVRGEVLWQVGGLLLSISLNELEYWLQFFLRYYRDQIGEVDHIDSDITYIAPRSNSRKSLLLVFRVPNAKPPLDEEELRRRLGLC